MLVEGCVGYFLIWFFAGLVSCCFAVCCLPLLVFMFFDELLLTSLQADTGAITSVHDDPAYYYHRAF